MIMETDVDMRGLIEQLLPTLYSSFDSNPVNIDTPDSFIPSGYVTKDLFENIKTALIKKRPSILKRWENYFGISCLKALSSHEMYLRYVMFACEIEIGILDVFDSLLSVCVLVATFITETLENTGVNFCKLTTDIFMEFYKRNIKEPFYWCGGFDQLAVYLRNEFLMEKSYFNGELAVPVTYRVSVQKDAYNRYKKAFEKTHLQPEYIMHDDIMLSHDCRILAKEVLSNTKVKLPFLPSQKELMVSLSFNRQNRPKDSKLKTMKIDPKRKAIGTNSKLEEVLLTAKIKLADVPRVTGGYLIGETTGRDSKGVTTGKYSEKEMTGKESKGETTVKDSKGETTVKDSKGETTGKYSKGEKTEKDLKGEKTAKDLKGEKTAKDSEGEKTAKDSEGEKTAKDSEGEKTAIDLEGEKTAIDLKGEKTAKDSKGERTAKYLKGEMVEMVSEQYSNLQMCDLVEQKTNIAWCENIVRQVIKYNILKSSYPSNANKRIQEAGEILELMKDTIKSLIEILDHYDK